MNTDQILEKLADIVRDVLDDEGIVISPSTTAEDVKGWDSANHINIIVSVETRFKVKFNTAEIERLRNVGDFIAAIQRKLSPK